MDKNIRLIILGCFLSMGLIAIGMMLATFLITIPSDCSMSITADNNTVKVLEETYKIVNLTHSGRSFNDFPKGKYNDSIILVCSVRVFYHGEIEVSGGFDVIPVDLEYYEFPCYSKEVKKHGN